MTDKQNYFTYTDNTSDNNDKTMENLHKQIIIDGVDVSGCNFLLKRENKILCECCHATGFGVICECEKWETCDHKQLKRKEQECEKAKKIIETAVDDFNLEYGTPQYDRLLDGAKSLGIEVKDYE